MIDVYQPIYSTIHKRILAGTNAIFDSIYFQIQSQLLQNILYGKLVILLCMQRSICKAVHDYPPAIQ